MVTNLKQGDRVGLGWIRNSCRVCYHCLQGEENVCKQGFTGLIVGNHVIFRQQSVVGSVVGGRRFMQEMLDFAAINQIKPMIQTMPLSQVNEAMDLVLAGKARYRIVLLSEEQ